MTESIGFVFRYTLVSSDQIQTGQNNLAPNAAGYQVDIQATHSFITI
jgi:hypothetical protein